MPPSRCSGRGGFVLGHQHVGHQAGPGQSALNHPVGGRRHHQSVPAGAAGVLGPHLLNHLEVAGHPLQRVALLLAAARLVPPARLAPQYLGRRLVHALLTRQGGGQRTTPMSLALLPVLLRPRGLGLRRGGVLGGRCRRLAPGTGLLLAQLGEKQGQLLGRQLLAGAAEVLAQRLAQPQLQLGVLLHQLREQAHHQLNGLLVLALGQQRAQQRRHPVHVRRLLARGHCAHASAHEPWHGPMTQEVFSRSRLQRWGLPAWPALAGLQINPLQQQRELHRFERDGRRVLRQRAR